MLTKSAVSPQKFQTFVHHSATSSSLSRAIASLKTGAHARSAKIAGAAFAVTLPLLGIVDPQVVLASGLADAQTAQAWLARADLALRTMAVVELAATAIAAGVAVAAMAGVGYLRTRYLAAQRSLLKSE